MNRKKLNISKQIKSIDINDAIIDLERLYLKRNNPFKDICNSINGNKFLDYFFFPYRLDTVSKKNVSFYDFYDNKLHLKHCNFESFKKYNTEHDRKNKHMIIYDFFRLYYGSISQFKPSIASYIYHLLKPKSVIDPCAGWGGRMLGAIIHNINYIGFDTNIDLKKPYKEIIELLNVKKNVKIIFRDSATIDFSKYKYDMVFTSPPYFKIELYRHMKNSGSKEMWLASFLYPMIINTFQYLEKNGNFVLNVPEEIYDDIKLILGACDKKIGLPITNRNFKKIGSTHYKEYIYIWTK